MMSFGQRGIVRSGQRIHGTVRWSSNRAKRGLFHRRDVAFGNNISFSERKTRRQWKPNVQKKKFWSPILNSWLRFNVSTHAIKCIDKKGGIDPYLLETPDNILNSIAGDNAKRMLLAKLYPEEPSAL